MDVVKVTERYYANNAKKLHKIVDNIIRPFGGLSQKDMDDFYSLANEVFYHAANDFNGKGNFEGFLYSRLLLKIRSLMTERNRQKRADVEIIKDHNGKKRKIYHQILSLDAPIKTEENDEYQTLGDVTESNFSLDDYTSDDMGLEFSEDVNIYLQMLPAKTRQIALLIGDGYRPCDICEKMKIKEKEYQIHMDIIRTYEYRKPMEWRYMK